MHPIWTSTRTFLAAGAVSLASMSASAAQDVGLVAGSFTATYVQASEGCSQLLVTGQFLAPTPGYKLTLAPNMAQSTALVLQLDLSATAPDDNAAQVLTSTPVSYFDAEYSGCHYGIAIVYGKQKEVVGLFPAHVNLRSK